MGTCRHHSATHMSSQHMDTLRRYRVHCVYIQTSAANRYLVYHIPAFDPVSHIRRRGIERDRLAGKHTLAGK